MYRQIFVESDQRYDKPHQNRIICFCLYPHAAVPNMGNSLRLCKMGLTLYEFCCSDLISRDMLLNDSQSMPISSLVLIGMAISKLPMAISFVALEIIRIGITTRFLNAVNRKTTITKTTPSVINTFNNTFLQGEVPHPYQSQPAVPISLTGYTWMHPQPQRLCNL